MAGYWGRILRADLTDRSVWVEELPFRLQRDYIGGTGLGVRLAYDEIPAQADPLGPWNRIILMTGPVTGTSYPTAGRYQLVFKSPLTGILCDSSSGGRWGAELKRAGFDGIVVTGVAEKPTYLWIHHGTAELRDASHLWGEDTFRCQEAIREELGDARISVAAIGLAGERGVPLASLMNDDARAAGRGGGGAVFGSKRLKAVAVLGSDAVPVANEEALRMEIGKLRRDRIASGWKTLGPLGTAAVLDNNWFIGDVPVKNWKQGVWREGCLKLGGEQMRRTILTGTAGCYRCPIRCGRVVDISRGPYAFAGPGPEYESLAALGTMTLVDDLEAVSYAAHLCNVYGLDTISVGATIAFAMEARERGILTAEQAEGLDLRWGNAQALVRATEAIGRREGFGALLGQGVRRLAKWLGQGAEEFAYEVKGLEAPMHDPRCWYSLAVTYATSNRGACHLHGSSQNLEYQDPMPEWGLTGDHSPYEPRKAMVAMVAQDHVNVINSMVICYFLPFTYQLTPSDLTAVLNSVTGFGYTLEEVRRIGERISNLHRAYNNRCGIRRQHDCLPKRGLEPVEEGGHAGRVPPLDELLDEYYQLRGWEADGIPSRAKLLSLGLDDVAEHFYPESANRRDGMAKE